MPPAPLTPRQRIGQDEMTRISASAGYPNDISGFLAAVEDMATGLRDVAQARQANTVDNWGFIAHYKNYSVTFRVMMQSSGW